METILFFVGAMFLVMGIVLHPTGNRLLSNLIIRLPLIGGGLFILFYAMHALGWIIKQ